MDNSLMKAALWRFAHRPRDWRRIAAWTLVVCMAIITASYIVGHTNQSRRSCRYDITGDAEYVCLDATDGAAVWKKTTP